MEFVLPEASLGFTPLPPGVYKATFTRVEPEPANLEKGYKAGVRFTWTIASEGEHKGKTVRRICGISSHPKAVLPVILLGITKVSQKPGNINLAPFVGKLYMVTLSDKRVESVAPLWE